MQIYAVLYHILGIHVFWYRQGGPGTNPLWTVWDDCTRVICCALLDK